MVELPEATLQIIAAIVQIASAVMAVIALTGLGKWIADKMGKPIDGNKVRAVTAGAAVLVALAAGVLGATIPGVGPLPVGADAQAWVTWLLGSAGALVLFANAVWRYVYKPGEPEPAPAPVTPTANTRL